MAQKAIASIIGDFEAGSLKPLGTSKSHSNHTVKNL